MADVLTTARPSAPDDFDLIADAAQAIDAVGVRAALTPLAWQTTRALCLRFDQLADARGPAPDALALRMAIADVVLAALVRGVRIIARGV